MLRDSSIATGRWRQTRRVLVVDDDLGMRETANLLLPRILGVHPETADCALGGLRIMERERIDLALIDLRLPDMSGLELIRRCRDQHIAIPWILMSGFMDYDAAREAGALGALRVIRLPIDLSVI